MQGFFINPLISMKKTVRNLSLVFALLLLTSSAFAQDCTSERDEFIGGTAIDCPDIEVPIEEHPENRLLYRGASFIDADGQKGIILTTASDSWNYLDDGTAYALVDGQRMEFDVYEIEATAKEGRVMEQNFFIMSDSQVRRVANASQFRVQYSNGVFDMTPLIKQAKRVMQIASSNRL